MQDQNKNKIYVGPKLTLPVTEVKVNGKYITPREFKKLSRKKKQ